MSGKSKPIRSMTGFARVRRSTDQGELVVSLKSVNHRGLDLRFHTSAELDPFENAMRTLLSRRLTRGHVDVRVSFDRVAGTNVVGLNRPLLEAYIEAFSQAAKEHRLSAEPDLNFAFRLPGMLAEPVERELGGGMEQAVLDALTEAVDVLGAFREREGQQLVQDIRPRVSAIGEAATRMEEIRSRALPQFQERLEKRLGELLEGVSLEPQRLAQEAAVLADRSDIGEELARLKIHASQLEEMLDAGGEVGKRMDFLMQEMHRETNTILSKSNGVGETGLEITDLGLAVKSDIEKIREQTLNLE